MITEILNAFMYRDDWREAINTPIGVIPTGSFR